VINLPTAGYSELHCRSGASRKLGGAEWSGEQQRKVAEKRWSGAERGAEGRGAGTERGLHK